MNLVDGLKRIDRAVFPDLLVKGLAAELKGMATVLDVGCGAGGPMLNVPKPSRLVGVDAFGPSLEALAARGVYDQLVQGIIGQVDLGAEGFDAVVCLDVIEHFDKAEALALVARLEGLGRRKVILATPNGFQPQSPVDGNPFQEHKCGFCVDELWGLGYRVRGYGGPRPLRGEFSELRFWPKPLWHRISGALQPITWRWPQGAFGLLAVKDLGAR